MATFIVDSKSSRGRNRRFWQAAGHDYLFKSVHDPDGQALLDRSREQGTIKYLRTHYTFSNSHPHHDRNAGGSICGKVMQIGGDGAVSYDFGRVNKTFQEYVRRGMKPVVEFDFFPAGICTPAEETANDEGFISYTEEITNWELWEELLEAFMKNLESVFGVEELQTWYFEVWNEPDGWPEELMPQFYRMYDLFADTVKSFNADYKVGGPACYHEHVLKQFLDHVVHGANAVTGEKGSPIDFISYHIYGLSGAWLNKSPEITPQVSRFSTCCLWLQRLLKKYPTLKEVEFHINEWGVCSNWHKTVMEYPQLEYRNSEFSALFAVKLVDVLMALEREHQFRTDLLLYWGFSFNAFKGEMFNGTRELTTTGNVPKPILTAWEMLSRLGSEFLSVEGPRPGGRLGLLAARERNKIQLLAYNFAETDDDLERADEIVVTLTGLTEERSIAADEYVLDRIHHNTFRMWQRLGSVASPDPNTIAKLMACAELRPNHSRTVAVTDAKASIKLRLPRHSMILVELRDNDTRKGSSID